MKLKDYLDKSKESRYKFAERAGICRQTVYHLLRGSHTPTLDTVKKVVKATGGAVTLDDL